MPTKGSKLNSNCCRICLKADSPFAGLQEIKNIHFKDISAIDALNEMFHLKIHPDELISKSIPRKICAKCKKNVGQSVELWILAGNSQQKIDEMLGEKSVRKLNESTPYKCPDCEERFETFDSLIQHLEAQSQQYSCNAQRKINMSCQVKENVKRALKHENVRKSKSLQQPHKNEETQIMKKKLNKCHICEKSFASQAYFVAHLKRHAGELNFLCPICEKMFSSDSALKIHCRTHTGEKPLTCPKCCKSFAQPAGLRYHMERHNTEFNHVCTTCGLKTQGPITLRAHILYAHTQNGNINKRPQINRPFVCHHCAKHYVSKSSVKTHLKIAHFKTTMGRYKCNLCEMSFASLKDLKVHAGIHIHKRIYTCTECLEQFSTETAMDIHFVREHMGDCFRCRLCPMTFGTRSGIKQHEKIHNM